MHLRTLAFAAPIALGLGLAACDSRDYEAEIAALQSDLESARSELQTAQGENEQLKTQMEELQAQAEQSGGAGQEAGGAIEGDLNRIVENANAALTSLTALETQAPDADISGLRENVNQIMQAAQATAEQAGVQLQEAVQPAAGPEGQEEPAAGGQGEQSGQQQEPAAGDQPEPAAGPAEQDSESAQEPARDQPAQQGGQQQQ
jgi:chromosome segregation ATPase